MGDYVFRDEEEVLSEYLERFFALEKIASPPKGLEKALAGLPH